jgi:hypothetical protein
MKPGLLIFCGFSFGLSLHLLIQLGQTIGQAVDETVCLIHRDYQCPYIHQAFVGTSLGERYADVVVGKDDLADLIYKNVHLQLLLPFCGLCGKYLIQSGSGLCIIAG